MLPLLAGLAPFALVVGGAVAGDDSPMAAWAGTWLVYGGGAHLAVLESLDRGAGIALSIGAGLLINARLAVYSTTLAHHWRNESFGFKATMAATIVDPLFAVVEPRYRAEGDAVAKRSFCVGAALTLWFGWMLLVTAGALVGTRLGFVSALAVAAPICLAALVAPACASSPGRAAVAAGLVVTLLTSHVFGGAGLLAGIVTGAIAGSLVEGRQR
jgi:predicted branched-subunit amino acid permease